MKILFAFFIGLFSMMNYQPGNNSITSGSLNASSDSPLLGTKWKLMELSNNIVPANATAKEMYFVLKNDSTVSGNGGCNTFSGTYGLGNDNQILFGEVVRTNVYCSGIDFERKFLNVLSKADYYFIKGDTLSLNKGKLMSLAKFIAAH